MSKRTYTSEEIEAYLSGELPEADRKAFEAQLQRDKTLAAEVQLSQQIDAAVSDEAALAFQQLTQSLGKNYFVEENSEERTATVRRLPFYRRPLSIAASLLVLVALGLSWWWLNGKGGQSDEALYAAYFEPYTFNESVRGNDAPLNNYESAIRAYNAKDYPLAEQAFQAQLSEVPNDVRASFGLGLLYLNQPSPNLDAASDRFRMVIEDGKSLLVDKSKWYLALTCIRQGNRAAARPWLEQLIKADNAGLADQAKNLLEALE
ncbi:MAG: hypothetical protein KDC44_08485 [Phaeodactylibacter sp.]|nr:hypothetical protein [Phaeodactylibacter sp.]